MRGVGVEVGVEIGSNKMSEGAMGGRNKREKSVRGCIKRTKDVLREDMVACHPRVC